MQCSNVSVSLLTQYAGVGEPPGFAVGGVGRMAVGLTRVVCTCCKKAKKKQNTNTKLYQTLTSIQ